LGYPRHLKLKQKAKVRALRAKKGVKAAIKRATQAGQQESVLWSTPIDNPIFEARR
jgi:hypothetical protein